MEDQNKQNSNPQQVQPLTEVSGSSYISSSQPKKVLLPSAELAQEVRAEQAERATAESRQQPQAGAQNSAQQSAETPVTQPTPVSLPAAPEQATGATPTATAAPTQAVKYASSSIYPEATRGINRNDTGPPPPAPADELKDTPETYMFDDGYEVGKIIFIYQLVAGLVIGLLSSHLIQTLHTPIMLAVIYVVEYLITLLYIPYHVVRSDAVKEPLWTTLIGTATQTIIVGVGFALLAVMIKFLGSLGIFEIFVGIGFLIASYFLTKLSWGIAFSLVGKIKNKMIVRAIGIGVLAIIISGIGYHYLTATSPSSKNGISLSYAYSACQSNGLCNYKVGGNIPFSVNFYKGAKVINSKNGQSLIDYSPTTPGQGVNIGVATANPGTSCNPAETDSTFDVQVHGANATVCVFNNTASNLIRYTSYVRMNGKNYVITMISYGFQQNQDTIQSIFNSITIE